MLDLAKTEALQIFIASLPQMLNSVFNMKKVSVRQIVHGFSKLHNSLKPGQCVDITSHGQTIGQYIKRPARRIKMPNFYKEACKAGFGPEVGDALLKRLLADEE